MAGAAAHIGPYEIIGELGRGGMGVVYRARRAELDREYALKVIDPSVAADPAAAQRFEREARAAAALADLPGVVAVHDVGRTVDGRLYCAMDVIGGDDLEGVDVDLREAVDAVRQAAQTLAAAHDRGFVHRDIKPANLLRADDGRVLVADFGLVRSAAAGADVTRLTMSGVVLGTPSFMPPEQARGEAVDGRADVYALGATLYALATGRPPFDGDTIYGVIAQVLQQPARRPSRLVPGIPRDLDAVVLKCLAKRPDERYRSATALADDLARWLRGDAVQARLPSVVERTWRALRRRPVRVAGGALLTAAAAVAVWLAVRPESTEGVQIREAVAATEAVDAAVDQLGAYLALEQQAGTVLRELEMWTGVEATALQQRAVARMDAAADDIALQFPGAPAVEAWRTIARALARDPEAEQRLHELAAAGADPFVLLLELRYVAARYVAVSRNTQWTLHEGQLRILAAEEHEQRWAKLREQFRVLTDALAAHPQAERVHGEASFAALIEGLAALGAGDREAAVTTLARPAALDDPRTADAALNLRGSALMELGRLTEAAEVFEAAAAGGRFDSWFPAATNWSVEAQRALTVGEDPAPSWRRAITAYQKLLAQWHDHGDGHMGLSGAYAARARWSMGTNRDATEDVAHALAAADLAVRWLPGNSRVLVLRANALDCAAQWERSQQRPSAELLQRALADVDAAARLAEPRLPDLRTRGDICRRIARDRAPLAQRRVWFERALAAYEQVRRLDPSAPSSHLSIGLLHHDWGIARLQAGVAYHSYLERARVSYRAALDMEPGHLLTLASWLHMERYEADVAKRRRRGRGLALRRAAAVAEEMVSRHPKLGDGWRDRGEIHFEQASVAGPPGSPGHVALIERAESDLARAVALDPELWLNRALHAMMLQNLHRLDEALAELREAEKRQPENAGVQQALRAVRAALADRKR